MGFRGSQIPKSEEAVKWLDRLAPNLAHIYADSSGNGYTPNKLPLETQGVLGGFKGSNKLPNGWTGWDQMWCTPVDSSGNGHRPKSIRTTIPQVGMGGGGGGRG